MKTIIHVNQHIIKRNNKLGENNPVLTVKTHKSNIYAHVVEIQGPARVVYSPNKPLSCGARVWIETHAPVIIGDSSHGENRRDHRDADQGTNRSTAAQPTGTGKKT